MNQNKTLPARCVHVVDDEAEVRDSIALLLSTAEIETKSFDSAEAYLNAVALGQPVCVLLDNRLPGLRGLDLLKRIVEAGGDPAVIMITGHGDIPTAVEAMRLGAFHFVEKPFNGGVLLTIVEEALSRAEKMSNFQSETLEFKNRRGELSPREDEVFLLLLDGLPNKLIADRLNINSRTVEHHRAAIMHKMQARSISHLLRMALTIGATALK